MLRCRAAQTLAFAILASCSGRDDPSGSVRPGDSLLDLLATARIESYPSTNLPPEVFDLARGTLRIRTGSVPAQEWLEHGALPPDVLSALGPDTRVRHWFTRPPVERAREDSEVLAFASGVPVGRWQPGVEPFPGLSIWWDEESDLLHAYAASAPISVTVEYEADARRVFGDYEGIFADGDGSDLGAPREGREPPPPPSKVLRYEEIQNIARRGLLLPAPGAISFPLDPLPSPRLRVAVGLVDRSYRRVGQRLEREEGGSDGAEFLLEVEAESGTRAVWRHAARPGGPYFEETVDLSAWVGEPITLRLRTEPGPGGSAYYDYGLWADLRFVGGAKKRPDRPHVVLVIVDTLRADALGIYGAKRATSPRIDAWATSRATLFRDALSTAPWTLPSVTSILTGLTSHQHGVRQRQDALAAEIPTIASRLAAAGYEARGVTGGAYLRSAFGLHRGFDVYDSRFWREVPRDEVLEWIETRGSERPFFLLFHTYYPHAPYPFDDRFLDATPPYRGRLAGRDVTYPDVIFPYNEGVLPLDAEDQAYVRDLYLALVAAMDEFVGEFLDRLEDLLEEEPFVVVLTSDHGEELFEHDQIGHGHSLYQELLRVPLLVRFPSGKGESPRVGVVEQAVSTLDVVPTLLDLGGLERPDFLPGKSLAGELPAHRARFAAEPLYGFLSVLLRNEKLVRGVLRERRGKSVGPVELFDLSRDPFERESLHEQDPRKVDELTELLRRFLERYGPIAEGPAASDPPDADLLKRLQELGYLGSR